MHVNPSTIVKDRPALNWLVPLIALLALIASGTGLFSQGGDGPYFFTTLRGQTVEIYGRGLYRYDTLFSGAAFRGVDAVVLFMSLPLLAFSFIRHRRGSLRGTILLSGALSYLLYIGVSMTFGAAFNRLFLVYTALFSASLVALILTLSAIDMARLPGRIAAQLPRRATALFLCVAGLGTLLLWMSELVGPVLGRGVPELLGPYTTMSSHGLDSATVTPAAVVAGLYLWRRKAAGYLLAPPLLVLCILNGLNVLAQTASQTLAGIIFPPAVYIGMVGSWVVMGLVAIWLAIAFFRSVREAPPGSRLKELSGSRHSDRGAEKSSTPLPLG